MKRVTRAPIKPMTMVVIAQRTPKSTASAYTSKKLSDCCGKNSPGAIIRNKTKLTILVIFNPHSNASFVIEWWLFLWLVYEVCTMPYKPAKQNMMMSVIRIILKGNPINFRISSMSFVFGAITYVWLYCFYKQRSTEKLSIRIKLKEKEWTHYTIPRMCGGWSTFNSATWFGNLISI